MKETIVLSTVSPMEKLSKGPKELKEFANPLEVQQYEPISTPRTPRDKTTNQRIHMEGPMAPDAYVAEDSFVGHQWEGRPLVL